jgi:2-oxo-3-hexenedioate decarboxylase
MLQPTDPEPSNPEATARRLLDALAARRQIEPLTDADAALDLPAAYRVADAVTRLRIARGEVPVGRKIGFTNRTIWDEYNVHAPIWGPVWDSTLLPLGAPFPIATLVEPRIEPEILLRLSRPPRPGQSPAALIDCVGAISFGFELVQSLFPGWRFRAPDTVAAFGLHGALLHGPWVAVDPGTDWPRLLAAFGVTLSCDGRAMDEGHSANVMGGGPLAALAHLADLLAADPQAPLLQPSEIIATGTLTRALPVAAGETLAAEAHGLPLPPITLTLA